MGAVVVAPWVAEPFWARGAGMFRHGYTYSGHATVAAAALANIAIIEGEDLCGRALLLEKELTEALAPLAGHPLVEEVRGGTGVLAAVQISRDRLLEDPALGARAAMAARESGILTRALASGALQISPPLVVGDAELLELEGGLRTALDAVS